LLNFPFVKPGKQYQEFELELQLSDHIFFTITYLKGSHYKDMVV